MSNCHNKHTLKYTCEADAETQIKQLLERLSAKLGMRSAVYVNSVHNREGAYKKFGYVYVRSLEFFYALLNENIDGSARRTLIVKEEPEVTEDTEVWVPGASFDWGEDDSWSPPEYVDLPPVIPTESLTFKTRECTATLVFSRPDTHDTPREYNSSVLISTLPLGVSKQALEKKIKPFLEQKKGKFEKKDVVFPIIEYGNQSVRGRAHETIRLQFDASSTDGRLAMFMLKGLWFPQAVGTPILVSFWNEKENARRQRASPRGNKRTGRPTRVDSDGFISKSRR